MRKLTLLSAVMAAFLVAGASYVHAQGNSVRVAVFTADLFGGYCQELMTAIADRAGLEIAEFQPTAVADMVPACLTSAPLGQMAVIE